MTKRCNPHPSRAALIRPNVELTGSSVFDYIHPGDHAETAEQLGMKLPPGRGLSLSQGNVNEDGASSASSSSHSETPEPEFVEEINTMRGDFQAESLTSRMDVWIVSSIQCDAEEPA
ncbi:hypothetical protein KUCAC02_036786, partial [Chaenocephalus aceratus]